MPFKLKIHCRPSIPLILENVIYFLNEEISGEVETFSGEVET